MPINEKLQIPGVFLSGFVTAEADPIEKSSIWCYVCNINIELSTYNYQTMRNTSQGRSKSWINTDRKE